MTPPLAILQHPSGESERMTLEEAWIFCPSCETWDEWLDRVSRRMLAWPDHPDTWFSDYDP